MDSQNIFYIPIQIEPTSLSWDLFLGFSILISATLQFLNLSWLQTQILTFGGNVHNYLYMTRFLFSRFFVTSLSENIVVFILQKEQKVCIFFSTLLNKANLGLKKTFFLTSHITYDVTIHWIHDRSRKCMEVRRNAFVSFHVVSSQILKKKQYILHISTKECTFSYRWSWLL